jgi:ABC-type sugar transport system ATPase subunit
MLSFQNVSRTYQLDALSSVTPLHGLELTVRRGEFILLIGRSGCGKTTLLNLAAGLIRPTSGRIIIKDTVSWPTGRWPRSGPGPSASSSSSPA